MLILSNSQLGLGAVLSYATSIISLLLGLFYTPWMIDVIGADDYGLYTLAVSVINMFLIDLGLNTAISRFLSKCYAEGDIDKANAYLSSAYVMFSLLAAAVSIALIVVFVFIDEIYTGLTAEQLNTFKPLYVVVAMYSVISLPFMSQTSILVANEQFVAFKLCALLQKFFVTALTIVCLLMGQGVFSIVAATAVGNLVFILIRSIIIRKSTQVNVKLRKANFAMIRELLGFSGWVAISDMGARSLWAVTPTILGIFSNSFAIAMFGLASQLEGYVYTVADAISGLLMPSVTRALHSERSGEKLSALMIKVGRIQLFVIGIIEVCFFCFGSEFIHLWLGDGYDDLWLCTQLVIAPHIILLPQTAGSVALTAGNHVKSKASIVLIEAVLSLILCVFLCRPFGALGACVSVGAAFAFNALATNVLFVRKLDVNVSKYYRDTFLPWFAASVPTVILGSILPHVISASGWLGLITCGIIAAFFYAVIWWAFVSNEYERNLAFSFFRKNK